MSLAHAARVTYSTAASRRRAYGWRHAFQRERIAPVATILVVASIGFTLVYGASVARVGDAARGLKSGEVRDLTTVRSAGDLEPALATIFSQAGDRRFAAERIFAEVSKNRGTRSIVNVGALAVIRVPALPLVTRHDLEVYRERATATLADPRQARSMAVAMIPLLTPEQFRDLKSSFVVRSPGSFHGAFLLYAALFLLACLAMHVTAHAGGRLGDRLILPAAMLLAGIGFISLASLRDPLRDQLLFARYTQGFVLGAIAFVGASRIAYERSPLRRLSLIPLAGALTLSAALIVFGHGPSGSDAKVNLLGIQPIEIIRLLLVLFLAGWFAERWQLLRELHEPVHRKPSWLHGFRLPRRQHAFPVAIGVAVSVAFFFLQRDLGPALVLLTLFLCLYALSRGGAAFAMLGVAAIGLAFAVGYAIHFPATVSLRTAMWLSPWENGLARGDQIAHALWGFAAGGVSGTGAGLGMPSVVPAAHTDLILATVGEELGLVGVLACLTLFVVLVVRGFRIAGKAPDPYTMFLAIGLTLGLALQTLLITGGVLGLVPLSGVGVPFLSHGRSALILNLLGLGILWSISASSAEPATGAPADPRRLPRSVRPESVRGIESPAFAPAASGFAASFTRPLRMLALLLGVLGAMVVLRATWIQLVRADATLGRGQLARQADGELRYQYNPRLLNAAAVLPRGDIYDRSGVLLATSRWNELQGKREEYRQLGIDLASACTKSDPRYYPFGSATYHVLGDWVSRTNWGASNTAFLERGEDAFLSGYDDHASVVTLRDPQTSERRRVVRRNLAELVPLWRHRYDPGHRDVARLMKRNRDVRSTLDVRLQLRAARILKNDLAKAGLERGAVVVLDASRGDVLAVASWPQPEATLRGRTNRLPAVPPEAAATADQGPLFDRARFGLYPPGSTFKLVTAAAALERDPSLAGRTFSCYPLSDGRVGAVVRGRLVHDDPTDQAHGVVDLEKGVVVSCNAYFAQLAPLIGWPDLEWMATRFGITMGHPTASDRSAHLIEASYGQAQVLASPYRMAQVAAAIANAGTIPGIHWTSMPTDSEPAVSAMTAGSAQLITRYMRAVVQRGTAQRLAAVTPPIAGKTGTAQVADRPSHSWFVGYAPSGPARRRIAFAVLVENGGYGGVRATQVAGDVIAAARDLGYFDEQESQGSIK